MDEKTAKLLNKVGKKRAENSPTPKTPIQACSSNSHNGGLLPFNNSPTMLAGGIWAWNNEKDSSKFTEGEPQCHPFNTRFRSTQPKGIAVANRTFLR